MKKIEKPVEYIPYAGDSVIVNVKPLALWHLSVNEIQRDLGTPAFICRVHDASQSLQLAQGHSWGWG